MMESSMLSSSCRCCASTGAYKDVKSSYHWMGEEEIYADMLKDCFDITLSPASDGQDEGGICEICITQLRNAANFKKQVLQTDEQFKHKLQSGFFKPEIVKVEVSGEDENDSDDNPSAEEGYSGPEFEVPIKAESPEESKPKKRAAKKGPTTRAKKAKIDAEDPETSTKHFPPIKIVKVETMVDELITAPQPQNTVNKSKTKAKVKGNKTKDVPELNKHRTNIEIILESSNATPIKNCGDLGYACSFCTESYRIPADLKRHTIETHDYKTKKTFTKGTLMYNYLVRLDITSLLCTICDTNIETLEQLIDHLIQVHGKLFYKDIKSHIIPFRFDDQELRCVICQAEFNKFKGLFEHMAIHYRNFICDICDGGFVNRNSLYKHALVHQTGTFKCDKCPKVFKSQLNLKSHEKGTHVFGHMLKKCGYCNEKFNDSRKKQRHLAEVHGVQQKQKKCLSCDKTFEYQPDLTNHTKKYHMMEKRHNCKQCDKKFYDTKELKDHMVKHTGAREFQCDVCQKRYGRRKTLREHMRIHENDRRFKCEYCGQAFVQKCAWAGHVRSKHEDML